MKILVVAPFGRIEPGMKENLEAGPGRYSRRRRVPGGGLPAPV